MLESEELIIKFHEYIKDKYPDVPFSEVNKICRAPFIFLGKQMAKLTLPEIRFKYWGVFKVKQGRKDAIPKMTEKVIATGKLRPEKLEKINTIIANNLNSNKNDEQTTKD